MLATGQPGETRATAIVHVEEESGREEDSATIQLRLVVEPLVLGMRGVNQTRFMTI